MPILSEVGQDYARMVEDLNTAKGTVIQTLTTIAAENANICDEIAFVIARRVEQQSATGPKIYALYLLDSITKKVGQPYIHSFEQYVERSFMWAFNNATEKHRLSLMKLLNTWPTFFPAQHARLQTAVANAPPPPAAAPQADPRKKHSGPVKLQPRIPLPVVTNVPPPPSAPGVSEHTMALLKSLNPAIVQQALANPAMLQQLAAALPQADARPPPAPPAPQPDPPPPLGLDIPPPPPTRQPGVPAPPATSWSDVHKLPESQTRTTLAQLYRSDRPPCVQCGWRPRDKASMNRHMDWHFEKKKRVGAQVVHSRLWFAQGSEWLSQVNPHGLPPATAQPPAFFPGEENAGTPVCSTPMVNRVSVDDEQTSCPLCGDDFDVDFDDDTEQWMCVGATVAEVRDIAAGLVLNKIVHIKCYTPGTVPVLVAQSPRSQPTSPMLDPVHSNKRPAELTANGEPCPTADLTSPPLKKIKTEPVPRFPNESATDTAADSATVEAAPDIKAELLALLTQEGSADAASVKQEPP